MEEFGVVKVRRQVIEQAREFEQVRVPINVINLAAGLRWIGIEANHMTAPLFLSVGTSGFLENGNNARRRHERQSAPNSPNGNDAAFPHKIDTAHHRSSICHAVS